MAKICIAIRGWAEPASDDNVLRSCRTIFSIIRKLKLSLTLLPFQVLFAISFFVAVNDTPAAEATRAKRVLMVSAGSRFSIAFPTLEQNAVDKLRELNSGNLEFYSEYLDIIRFPSEKHSAQKALAELFPATPVIVAGVTEEDLPSGRLGEHATGIAQRVDADGTMTSILQMQPHVKRVVLIGGTTEVDQAVINRVLQSANLYKDRVELAAGRLRR
jgi:hypothetical protein